MNRYNQKAGVQKIPGHTDITAMMNTYCDAFESYQREIIAKTDEYLDKPGTINESNIVETSEQKSAG